MENIALKMPKTESPTLSGINDGGMETYRNTPMLSLTKEELQNSTDAGLKNGKPILVEFNDFEVNTNDIPCIDELKKIYSDELEFWDNYLNNDKKTVDFYKNAIKILNRDKIRCLRISDFNTTGLGGIKNINDSSPWYNLVINRYVSDKPQGSAGSFGIGKDSAFASSGLRLVFYNTINTEGERGFQGTLRLTSYRKGNEKYTGDGFFCQSNKNEIMPIYDNHSFDPSFNRVETGMDKFIFGFSEDLTPEDLKEAIIVNSINNFLYAFYNDRLVVKYGDITINRDNLDEIIEKYRSKFKPETVENYETLKNPDRTISVDVFEKEDVTIYVKLDPDYHRKAAVVRQTGMKIFDKTGINGTIGFSSVIVLTKDEVNQYFKKLENPEHTQWSEFRGINENEVKKNWNKFYNALKNVILELRADEFSESTDSDGASDYLALAYVTGNKNKTEGLSNEAKEVKRKPKKKKTKEENTRTNEQFTYVEDENGNIIEETIDVTVGGSSGGGGERIEPQGGKISDPDGTETSVIISDKFIPNKIISVDKLKFALNEDNNLMTLRLMTIEDVKNGFIEIDLSGEDNKIKTRVISAKIDGVDTEFKDNKIYVGDLKENDVHTVTFELIDKGNWALEVNTYEGKN